MGTGTIPLKQTEMDQRTRKVPVVEVKYISKSFGNIRVIRDLSFKINQGEILALLGPSGCGKTTILRLIAGFENLGGGEIYIQGERMANTSFSIPPEKRSVGMVFQDYALFPHMTVAGNVLYGLKGMERWRQEKILEGMLRLVGLRGYRSRYPHQLSGGEQQRVSVARALAPCPAALLLDEPFSNLDADMRSRMRLEVLSILRKAKTTAILVTHDREEAFSLADRVGVLNRGSLEQLDTPEVLYHQPKTPFVARFVGLADFLTAQVKNGSVVTELGSFLLNGLISSTSLMVMIRPDDIDFIPDERGDALLVGREFLGSENLYKIRLGSGEVIRSIQPSTAVYLVGQKVQIHANLDHVIVFRSEEVEED